MIKSTKTTLKFANSGKLDQLRLFIGEYRKVVMDFVDILWKENDVTPLVPKEITSQIHSWLSARAIQCAGKQASAIVRGTKTKQRRRLYVISKLKEDGKFKQARKLQKIYDQTLVSKPVIDKISPELDARFVKIDLENKTSFDGWVTLASLGYKTKLTVPFKKHKHFNKMIQSGTLKNCVRLSENQLTLMFDTPEPVVKTNGQTIGLDVGQKTALSCSNGQTIGTDKHGHTYQTICDKLARKTKDSKAFNRTVTHRTNYINWSINQLNLTNVKQVNIENIKNLYKGRRMSRRMKHWNYRELFDKLESKLFDAGVQIEKRNPTYTSQRCSKCGWTRKSNRKLKEFKCTKCGYTHDADLNASTNLSLNLLPIGKKERLQHKNKAGFYWYVVGQEPIVPVVLKE